MDFYHEDRQKRFTLEKDSIQLHTETGPKSKQR